MEDLEHIQETNEIELKSSSEKLSKDVWETYSAFANGKGGTIYLGIKEISPGNNEIVGVKNPEQQKEDFFNTLNNKTKVSDGSLVTDEDFVILDYDEKSVIRITVNECKRNAKPVYLNNNIHDSFIRRNKADERLSDDEIRSFLIDSSNDPYDLLPNPMNYGVHDIEKETLSLFRKRVNISFPNNRFKEMDDDEFLRSIGCLTTNKEGNMVLTVAAVLMFTTYYKIRTIFPHYYIDYRQATSFSSKWNDRISADSPEIIGNLYSMYELLYQKISMVAPKPYVQENGLDIGSGLFDDCIREMLTNAFSNAAFALDNGIRILANNEFVFVSNPGKMKVGLEQALTGGISKPRNEGVMTLLRICGRSDKGGTGIPNIFAFTKKYGLKTPLLQESISPDETRFTLYFKGGNVQENARSSNKDKLLISIIDSGNDGLSSKEMEETYGLSHATAYRLIKELLDEGKIRSNNKATNGKRYIAV